MKLINGEPTPEMLAIIRNEPEVFGDAAGLWSALYDAAPEIQQAEIAQLKARIVELEQKTAELTRRRDSWYLRFTDIEVVNNQQAERIKELKFFQAQHIEKIDEQAERIKEIEQSPTMTAVRDAIQSTALAETEKQAERIAELEQEAKTAWRKFGEQCEAHVKTINERDALAERIKELEAHQCAPVCVFHQGEQLAKRDERIKEIEKCG